MRRRMPLLSLIAAILISGCLDRSIIEDGDQVAKLEDEPRKTVVIWHTYSDEETRVFEEEVVPKFEKEYPHIRIESVRQAYNQEYQAVLLARASAGKTPDLIRMDYTWVQQFAHNGLLQPLEGFDGFEEVASRLRRRMLETTLYEGNTYGLPLNITTKAAIYNNRLLKEAGLAKPPESVAEIIRVARDHHYIIGMLGLEMWQSLPYFFGLGGKFSDDGFTQTDGYLNSPESIQAVETLVELYHEGILNPGMLDGSADLWNDVHSGRDTFMIDEGPWYYSILLNTPSLNLNVLELTTPAPFPSNGRYRSVIGGESLVMTKGTRHKEEAWTFIRFMMRKDVQGMMFKAGLIPTNMEAFEGERTSIADNGYIGPYMQGIDEGYYLPPHPKWAVISQIYADRLEDIFVSGRDVKEALNEASSQIDAILKKRTHSAAG